VILICYDGSQDAKAAIEHAGELLGSEPATVLTVWQPFFEVLTASGFGLTPAVINFEEVDEANSTNAKLRADEGTKLARRAGLNAKSRTCSQVTTTAAAVLCEAEAVGASAIVIGSRGLTGLKSLLLGSVSHAVIQHADRTVIVVPSPEVAASRAHGRRAVDGSG
jgi:nucleotide-binding universal stress UspA family protein